MQRSTALICALSEMEVLDSWSGIERRKPC